MHHGTPPSYQSRVEDSTGVLPDVEDAGKRALMLWRGPLVKVGKEGKEDGGVDDEGGARKIAQVMGCKYEGERNW